MNTSKIKNYITTNKSAFIEKYGIIFVLLGMMVIMSILKPEFLTSNNLFNIVRQQTPVAIMALGLTLCIISGGIDVSGGAVIAFSAVICASLAHPVIPLESEAAGQFPLIVPIIVPIIIGGLCGTINGLAIAYGNVPPFIATLGMMSIARGAALMFTGGKPIDDFTDKFEYIGRGDLLGIPFPVYILIIMLVVGYIILHKTRFGTYVYAIGSNETAAIVSGVNVKLNKTLVYTIAGMFTGVASIVLTSRILAGQPAAGSGYEMDAITGAIIGGTSFSGGIGTMIGTIIGAMIMGVLTNAMTMLQIDPHLQKVVKGAVIIIAVLLDERRNRKK